MNQVQKRVHASPSPSTPLNIGTSDSIAEAWSTHRGFLLGIAYRLLGSYSDAEDVVQEAFARLLRSELDQIEDLRGWLAVVVNRLCFDQLRSARMRHERTAAHFPEPLIGPQDNPTDALDLVTLDESVRMTFLIALERMSPAERVVFVLHDVLDYSFEQVASIVGRSAAACRQLASRARRWLKDEAGLPRFPMNPEEQSRVVDAFIAACSTGSMAALLQVLDPAVIGWADAGRRPSSLSEPIVGAQQVAAGVMRFFAPWSGTRLEARLVNGEPGILAVRKTAVFAVVVLIAKQGRITELYAQADPRKLTHVSA
jgi:RNA polymerase sigma-70 factor (ECF subfamily)